MNLFYHHVGQEGAAEDFRRTVFKKLPISLVSKSVSNDNQYRNILLDELQANFPSGMFNCWGVPEGAISVIKYLIEDDVVLLVESARIDGKIPALCQVKVFIKQPFRQLSNALWGNDKYPYIFFHNTEPINLPWIEFLEQVGYRQNYNPSGNFLMVNVDRLDKIGGAQKFVEFLRKEYGTNEKLVPISREELKSEIEDQPNEDKKGIELELPGLTVQSLTATPNLEESNSRYTQAKVRARNGAFRVAIRKLYVDTCAACRSNLYSPDGRAEVESAHIYPRKLNGSNDYRNGIALCHFHHWAFDCGWFSITDDLTILVQDDLPNGEGYKRIAELRGKKLLPPSKLVYSPHSLYLSNHRKIHGF